MSSLSDYIYKGPEISLTSGRNINIQRIEQSLTYAHILEGIPYGPHYQSTVKLHLDWAKQRYPNRKLIVLEPRLRPLQISEAALEKLTSAWSESNQSKTDMGKNDNEALDAAIMSRYPEPVCIGSVCCRALFESTPIDDNAGMLSELIVIWFQDGFAMPVDPHVIEQIIAINWEKQAVDTDL